MNWGTGIAIVLAGFVILILSFVYRSTQQDFHLVTKNYYEEALVHDEVQTKRSNYTKLEEEASIKFDAATSKLHVDLPALFDDKELDGTIHLYNPKDAKQDQYFRIEATDPSITTKDLSYGLWKVLVEWTADETAYLFEKSVFITQ